MNHLSPFTCRRLHRLPKLVSVWEGDRRSLITVPDEVKTDEAVGDCILWVDGTQGVIRALTMVPQDTGHEAVVRTLVQAIEHPQSSVDPARPRKIVVRDRELQFFLRGALQDLDIDVEYTTELPLIDEIFNNLIQEEGPESDELPQEYAATLLEKAATIWQDAPWYLFNEQEILAIDINQWDIETLYVSVLGMADVEYGLLLYRNLESLKQFRQRVLSSQDASPKELQQAFLDQDCLFVNFEPEQNDEVLIDGMLNAMGTIDYEFGSIHPLEGLRGCLANEEAATLIVALEAIHRLIKKHGSQLEDLVLQPLSNRFRIPNPVPQADKTLAITVRTLPEISAELIAQTEELGMSAPEEFFSLPQIRDDVVPDGSLILLTELAIDVMDNLRHRPKVFHQPPLHPTRKFSKPTPWPCLIIQTTRPKATVLIEKIQTFGGIEALCFNAGSDPFSRCHYQLGLLKSADGAFHLFHEYEMDNPQHRQALGKWQTGQTQSQGRCGIVIAAGVSGNARGKPRLRDMMAFLEVESVDPESLNLAPLVLNHAIDFEL